MLRHLVFWTQHQIPVFFRPSVSLTLVILADVINNKNLYFYNIYTSALLFKSLFIYSFLKENNAFIQKGYIRM